MGLVEFFGYLVIAVLLSPFWMPLAVGFIVFLGFVFQAVVLIFAGITEKDSSKNG